MADVVPTNTVKTEKKFYNKWWFWVIVAIVLIVAFSSGSSSQDQDNQTSSNSSTSSVPEATAEEAVNEEPAVPAEYKSALKKAESYSSTMNMSKRGVYDQLVSEYGEKFTPEAAQYAIDNVKADWNANALAKAKSYQESMNMSPAAIRDQLVSEYGEKFTAAEADYAIANLNN